MSDAHKKDGTSEDDFELDDFDDGDVDDFSDDESWDDPDDDLIAESEADFSEMDAEASAQGAGEERPLKKKNKLFTLALIGGASVVALLILASTLGGGPKTPAPASSDMAVGAQGASALPGFEGGTDLPPQPAPIQADNGAAQGEGGVGGASVERASGDVLTPMPPSGEDVEAELADLGFDLGGAAQPEEKEEGAAGGNGGSVLEEIAGMDKPPVEVEIDEVTAVSPLSQAESARLAEAGTEGSIAEFSAAPSSPSPVPAAAPQAVVGGDSSEIKRLDGEIGRLDEKLAAVSADLSQKIAVTDAKLDDVARTLDSLGAKLDQVAARPVESVSAPVPAPVSKPADVAASPSAAAAPVVSAQKPQPVSASDTASTASVTDGPLWVLRSAQPGKAVLSEKGSNDLKTVEVGDSLKGIGKIVAIEKVDGRWIVQGMQGIVSQ